MQKFKPSGAERFTSAFCRECGSSMPWANPARGVVVVPMGAVDDDPGVRSRAHIFVGSKAPWFTITDALPQHPERPG